MVQADALSRRADHNDGKEDNQEITLIPLDAIINAVLSDLLTEIAENQERDPEVVEALQWQKKKGKTPPSFHPEDWRSNEGLVYFKNKLYIPPDQELRRKIVAMHHEPEVMGHPGVFKTTEEVSREYWWPKMKTFIQQYVRGCAICQSNKVNTHPTTPESMPIKSQSRRPFGTITVDHITDLPRSKGYDTIQVMVDHDVTKGAIFAACTKQIDALGTAQIMDKEVYRRFGLPERIISDRGPQFAAKAFREWNKVLGIETRMSTAYHPQTDGETERVNQELEVALRIYCNANPETWADKLHHFEFAHNHRTHEVTKQTPFLLMMGYQPNAVGTVLPEGKVPATQQRLIQLSKDREEARSAINLASEQVKERIKRTSVPFTQGMKVWLDGRNLKTGYPHRKLAPKRLGPFRIKKVMGRTTYRLQLPNKWKVHDVFHGSMLTPYHETTEHGRNYIEPPPDIVEGEEEYEVENILSHRIRRGKQEYLVSWKGYSASENEWLTETNLQHAKDTLRTYKKRHKIR